jgi:hypothetical protein
MNTVEESLAECVARTLRGVIEVRQPKNHFIINRPEFWDHCHLVAPDCWQNPPPQIFVDGFAGCCHWNSWKVYSDAIEPDVSLWMGYALYGASWVRHAWCMYNGRIIETTVPYRVYFGAQLTADECEQYCRKYEAYAFGEFEKCDVLTFVDGRRKVVHYDPEKFSQTIGRERDQNTSQVKVGLGR